MVNMVVVMDFGVVADFVTLHLGVPCHVDARRALFAARWPDAHEASICRAIRAKGFAIIGLLAVLLATAHHPYIYIFRVVVVLVALAVHFVHCGVDAHHTGLAARCWGAGAS
jgi:hypothetical protein